MPDYSYTRPPLHLNDVDPETGQIVSGWRLSVRDHVTGAHVPVFVPDRVFGPEQAKQLIEASLATVRAVHAIALPPVTSQA